MADRVHLAYAFAVESLVCLFYPSECIVGSLRSSLPSCWFDVLAGHLARNCPDGSSGANGGGGGGYGRYDSSRGGGYSRSYDRDYPSGYGSGSGHRDDRYGSSDHGYGRSIRDYDHDRYDRSRDHDYDRRGAYGGGGGGYGKRTRDSRDSYHEDDRRGRYSDDRRRDRDSKHEEKKLPFEERVSQHSTLYALVDTIQRADS